jgi:hypothetical protein
MSMLLLAAALLAEAPDAKEDLLAAIKKLSDAPSYAWTSTPKNNAPDAGGGQGGRRAGPSAGEGKTEKDGFTWLSSKMGETTLEAVAKGDKGAVKTADGWKAASEFQAQGRPAQGQRPDPASLMARALRNWKSPAATAESLAGKAKEVKAEADGLYTAELTEEGAKEQLTGGGGRPGGGQNRGPEISDAKGSVKFWVKDGVLVKYEHTVSGKMKFGEREAGIDRTTTVEIKDVGTAKVEVPDDAKAKLQ